MKFLFTFTLMIMALLSHSQSPQKDIERLDKSSWKISNDAAQSHHYLVAENDSLRAKNKELRIAIDSLELRNQKLIDDIFKIAEQQAAALNNQSNAINDQSNAIEDLEESNNFIQDYWKNLSRDSKLSGVITTDAMNVNKIRYQAILLFPLVDRWKIIATPIYGSDIEPIYRLGVSYSFW